MKVLIVHESLRAALSGYELRCAQVAGYLRRLGHEVQVVTSSFQVSGSTEGAFEQADRVNDVRVARFLPYDRLDNRQSRRNFIEHYQAGKQRCGNPRIHEDLIEQSEPVSRKWVIPWCRRTA
jgi:hypothetical protein